MKVAFLRKYGAVENLEIAEQPCPKPGSQEILIRMEASAVHSAEIRLRKADPWAVRLLLGLFRPNKILGGIVVGEIVAIGSRVQKWQVGDRVMGQTGMKFGAHAQWVLLSENACLVHQTKSVHPHKLAASIFGAQCALEYMDKIKNFNQAGQRVLVVGAGVVGLMYAQIAKIRGYQVSVWARESQREFLHQIGIDEICTSTDQISGQFDIIVDTARVFRPKILLSYLHPKGYYQAISASFADMIFTPFFKQKGQSFHAGIIPLHSKTLETLRELLESGQLQCPIDSIYHLDQIRQAHTRVEKGGNRGTVLLTF